ncbi:hypothetical protein H6G00_22250 [Leptolyngbya sp. FACHB-541]|uniref:hypothetical protein n=1 Tax=Leptolyngbya sp. FACHB-541 TaxID=2692810 RepID=UPI001681FD57|nr:hypothetical protein [Leptolyngbya sp. FACHB-541]MBD1999299.1 hypothetical protein [Leptolyngbya sp. FACHB-541]
MNSFIWLAGSLSSHRRSRILQSAVEAQPTAQIPEVGICLLFGTDFQEGEETSQQDWYTWTQKPGRALLLIPPFKSGSCSIPSSWQISRRSAPPAHQNLPLATTLASEVQYELQGQLQVATQLGGLWDDQSICTAYYRKHPHSGIFAITCLPLWSLSALDQATELQSWLAELYLLAGSPVEDPSLPKAEEIELQPEHYTVLLHLVSGPFANESAALAALHHSSIFAVDTDRAKACLQDAQQHGLVIGGQLTELGRDILQRSPYRAYINSLEALKR